MVYQACQNRTKISQIVLDALVHPRILALITESVNRDPALAIKAGRDQCASLECASASLNVLEMDFVNLESALVRMDGREMTALPQSALVRHPVLVMEHVLISIFAFAIANGKVETVLNFAVQEHQNVLPKESVSMVFATVTMASTASRVSVSFAMVANSSALAKEDV